MGQPETETAELSDIGRMKVSFREHIRTGLTMVGDTDIVVWVQKFVNEVNELEPEANVQGWFSTDFTTFAITYRGKMIRVKLRDL